MGVVTDPLLVDVYAGDLDGAPNWPALVAAGPPWHGAILKATEGLYYRPAWLAAQMRRLALAAGPRRGRDFFRGCYHYFRANQGGALQADFFVDAAIDAGWDAVDLPLIVDVERANNAGATAAQIVSGVSEFSARVQTRTGRAPILYGGELLAALGIHDRMGCSALWIARYTPTLPAEVYERIGWDAASLGLWQYAGDGESYLAGYPAMSPIGKVDVSAVVARGGGDAALAWMRGDRPA